MSDNLFIFLLILLVLLLCNWQKTIDGVIEIHDAWQPCECQCADGKAGAGG